MKKEINNFNLFESSDLYSIRTRVRARRRKEKIKKLWKLEIV